jgi:phosphatidylglycerophosphate synthase
MGFASSASFLERVREARRIAQPPAVSPSATDIPYRHVSIFPSVVLARWGVRPNEVTVTWIFLGLVGVLAIGWPAYSARVAGAILLQVSYLLDFVDGEVARLRRQTSKRGLFLDLTGHGLIKTALFLAAGYRVFIATGKFAFLLLAFSACVSISNSYALQFYAASASLHNRSAPERGVAGPAGSLRQWLGLVGYLFESPGLYGTVLVAAILNRLDWVLILYGFLGPLRLWHRAMKYREG